MALKTRMRFAPSSATTTLPDGSTATPHGAVRAPPSVAEPSHEARSAPEVAYFRTQPWSRSVT